MKNFKAQNTYFLLPRKFLFVVRLWGVIIIILNSVSASFAQQNTLVIEGTSPKLFINHKVISKENFYSLARLYNVPPKDIAAYNNLQFEHGLNVGESIKIPLNENNFSQLDPVGNGEVLIPVYHTVQSKEGLYRVSLNYNKVPIASLKKWNHIQADAVSAGSPLIVGYLKTTNESSLVDKASKADMNAVSTEKPQTTPEPANPGINSEKTPSAKSPDTGKQEDKNAQETAEPKVTVTSANTRSSINFSGGYFKKLYDSQAENKTQMNQTGNAGVFKSTSGWQDGKYYCFNNDAPPGTIIKITANSTGKSVYAKVLDAIPDIKQNSDLTLILSNAAAEELGGLEGKFDCALSYAK